MTHAAKSTRRLAVALMLGSAVIAAPAQADTLREALASAYNTNPTLQAARANQRATDENVVINKAQGIRWGSLITLRGTFTPELIKLAQDI